MNWFRRPQKPSHEANTTLWKRPEVGYAYLGNGVGITKTHRGHRIFVYTKDFGLNPHVILDGIWEWGIEHALVNLVKPGDSIVEVGANIGYHTLVMAQAAGESGKIFSFEANPEVYRLLKWTIDYNSFSPRVNLYNHAVTDVRGKIEFTFDTECIGSGGIMSESTTALEKTIEVEGIPLDVTLKDIERVDLIRMDAEGSEPLIIRGASELISRSPKLTVVLEWSTEMMSKRTDVEEFIEEINNHGFRASVINGDSTLTPIENTNLLNLPHLDICLMKTD